jgi:hypothetical protein
MPLSPLPANTSARVFVDYITGNDVTSQEHTVAWRFVAAPNAARDTMLALADFLIGIGPAVFATGWRVLRARSQAAGATFSVPETVPPVLAAFAGAGGDVPAPFREALEWTWQGRSFTSGRRVDFSLYGLVTAPPDNFRVVPGDYPWVGPSVDFLNAVGAGLKPRAIDGSTATFYPYVNSNFNSYWERRIRLS